MGAWCIIIIPWHLFPSTTSISHESDGREWHRYKICTALQFDIPGMLDTSSSLGKHQRDNSTSIKSVGGGLVEANDPFVWVPLHIHEENVAFVLGACPIIAWWRRSTWCDASSKCAWHTSSTGRHQRCSRSGWRLPKCEGWGRQIYVTNNGEVEVRRILIVKGTHPNEFPFARARVWSRWDDTARCVPHYSSNTALYRTSSVNSKSRKVMPWSEKCLVWLEFECTAPVLVIQGHYIMIRK